MDDIAECEWGAFSDGEEEDNGRGGGVPLRDDEFTPGPFIGVGRRLCTGDMPPLTPLLLDVCEECERAGDVGSILDLSRPPATEEGGGRGVRRELVLVGGGGSVL